MKLISKVDLKRLLLFLVEVLIPFLVAPILPEIWDCTKAEAFLIGSCVTIYLSTWTISHKMDDAEDGGQNHNEETISEFRGLNQKIDSGFTRIDQKVDAIYTFKRFEEELQNVSNPYFNRRLTDALKRELDAFREKNRFIYEGYVETHPYDANTFGVEGIKWTEKELLAVSSIDDYWERSGFTSEYKKAQYDLIKNRRVVIKRIFVASSKKMEALQEEMKEQSENGIQVFYIVSDSGFCPVEWAKEDFLIQDGCLLVDMKEVDSHRPVDEGREIITIREFDVSEKQRVFYNMLHNAKQYTTDNTGVEILK